MFFRYIYRIGKNNWFQCQKVNKVQVKMKKKNIYRLPFDWKNPIGFFVAFNIMNILHWNLCFLMISALSLGIGLYLLITSLTKDIKNDVIGFSDQIKTEPNPMILARQLFDCIQFHSTVKRYTKTKIQALFFLHSHLINNFFFFVQTYFGFIWTCSTDIYCSIFGKHNNHMYCNGVYTNRIGKHIEFISLILFKKNFDLQKKTIFFSFVQKLMD